MYPASEILCKFDPICSLIFYSFKSFFVAYSDSSLVVSFLWVAVSQICPYRTLYQLNLSSQKAFIGGINTVAFTFWALSNFLLTSLESKLRHTEFPSPGLETTAFCLKELLHFFIADNSSTIISIEWPTKITLWILSL